MKTKFTVNIDKFQVLSEIEGSWTHEDYRKLLNNMDFDDVAKLGDDDIHEMCLMSLQDLEPQKAVETILQYKLGDDLNQGQIQQAAHDMQNEKIWEEYSDIGLHEKMFYAATLAKDAFPGSFPKPDAVQIDLTVIAENDDAKSCLSEASNEPFLARLLHDGMGDGSILHRLFEESLAGQSFPEASNIIWIMEEEKVDENTSKFKITSSGCWLGALSEATTYVSHAYADE